MANAYASPRQPGRTPQAPTRQTGAWKLAYADFLTALCAFFLVMWLIHGVSGDEKNELARQFGAEDQVVALLPPPPSRFEAVMQQLKSTDLLTDGSMNVSVLRDGNTLRIELVDLDMSPLFEKGEAGLNERGNKLIELAADAISLLDFPVSIEGHTDSDPIVRPHYSNWELSADRANAARRALIANGVPVNRITSVSGLADTRPLDTDTPYLPQNRRLSIVLNL